MLVDSHCHLNFPELKGQIDDLVARAGANDVKVLQTICTRMSEFDEIHAISKSYDNIFCSVGVHPNNSQETKVVSCQEVIEKTQNPKVIAIGETGLDYYYENSKKEIQKLSFEQHIKAAQQTQLPIIVHTRDADDDTIDMLTSAYKDKPFPGLIHCFTSSEKLAFAMLDIGFYISISGIVTFKSAKSLQETAKKLPLDRILVETDAPYLAPMPHRGKTNEPSFTRHTAEFLASLRSEPYEILAKATTDNFFRLFSKANRAAY